MSDELVPFGIERVPLARAAMKAMARRRRFEPRQPEERAAWRNEPPGFWDRAAAAQRDHPHFGDLPVPPTTQETD